MSEAPDQAQERDKWIEGDDDSDARNAASVVNPTLPFKKKVILTIIVFGAYSTIAISMGILGPTLVDLELRFDTTMEKIALLFTIRNSVALVGSLGLGPLCDHVNALLVMAVILTCAGTCVVLSTLCTTLVPFLFLTSLDGLAGSALSIGANYICIGIWRKQSGPILQALHLTFVVGLAVAPLLAQPFLLADEPGTGAKHSNCSGQSGSTSNDTLIQQSGYKNLTPLLRNADTMSENNSLVLDFGNTSDALADAPNCVHLNSPGFLSNESSIVNTHAQRRQTTVRYVYLISGLWSLVWGCVLFSTFLIFGCQWGDMWKDVDQKHTQESEKSLFFRVTTSLLFALHMACYSGFEVAYPGFLLTFAVKQLGWSKDEGVMVTFMYQMFCMLATIICVGLSRCMKAKKLLLCDVVLVTVATVCLCIAVTWDHLVLWVCTAVMGFGYSALIPCSYSWVREHMPVKGTFSAAYWSGFFGSSTLGPYALGYFFEYVTPLVFPFFMLACAVGLIVVFILFSLLIYYESRNSPVNSHKEICMEVEAE